MELMHSTERTKDTPFVVKAIETAKCIECSSVENAHYFIYEPLEDLITWFPDQRLIHIHFGKASWNEEITNQEAQWTLDATQVCLDKSEKSIFCLADFSHIDDSDFPTREAIKLYAKSVNREKTAHTITYGASSAMQMVMKIIGTVSTTARKVGFSPTHDTAMVEYKKWFDQEAANTVPQPEAPASAVE